MKTIKNLTIAALALLIASCSKDNNEMSTLQLAKTEGITITAQLAPKDGGTTRAVSDQGTYIKAEWAKNEHIAILYEVSSTKKVADAEITAVDGTTGVATITFTVDGSTANNTACTLVYPLSAAKNDNSGVKDYATLFSTQNGALSANLDIRVGAGTIQTASPSLTVTTQPAAQYSIFKMTLKDIAGTADKSASEFIVRNSSNNIITTVTPTSATNELYVALPALETGTYWFSATVSSQPYIAKATVSTATTAGNYYQSTVRMATLGDLMDQDGKFYADAAAITTAGTTAIGVIAYLGSDVYTETIANGGGHGLVLCLKNAGSDVGWSTENVSKFSGQEVTNRDGLLRTENVSGYTNTATLTVDAETAAKYPPADNAKNYTELTAPIGTTGWFLPSAQQWVRMMLGLGGLSDVGWGWFNNDHTGADKWEAALAKSGSGNYDSMTNNCLWYWASSEAASDRAVALCIDASGSDTTKGFNWNSYSKSDASRTRVRPILAF